MTKDVAHFKIPRPLVYKLITLLLMTVIALCLYTYQNDESITRASLKTNQQAIQATLDAAEENEKNIAVGKERMTGHEVNPVAHTN